jgi:hypothetical protein
MFEKEAEEYAKKWILDEDDILLAFESYRDGAEFGYNKANEWHYVKDGDLPPEDTKVFALMANKGVCIAHFYRRNVWDKIGTVIAWKEIVLPELKEIE